MKVNNINNIEVLKRAETLSEDEVNPISNDVELKIAKTDDFGNQYFIKEIVNPNLIQNEIDFNNQQIENIQNRNAELQNKLNIINQ